MKDIPSTVPTCVELLSPNQLDHVIILTSHKQPKKHCEKYKKSNKCKNELSCISSKICSDWGLPPKKLQHCNIVALNPLHKPVYKCCSFLGTATLLQHCGPQPASQARVQMLQFFGGLQQTAPFSRLFINPAIYKRKCTSLTSRKCNKCNTNIIVITSNICSDWGPPQKL